MLGRKQSLVFDEELFLALGGRNTRPVDEDHDDHDDLAFDQSEFDKLQAQEAEKARNRARAGERLEAERLRKEALAQSQRECAREIASFAAADAKAMAIEQVERAKVAELELAASVGFKGRLADLEDLSTMTSVNEEIVLRTIRERFEEDRIYTFSGLTLIAVNPFKRIEGLYSDQKLEEFVIVGSKSKQPHIFSVAARAYRALLGCPQNQVILMAGESGAGKTESAKYALRCLTTIGGSDDNRIEMKVMEANPILEAFGNARTVRNNNSSRFGRATELLFVAKPGIDTSSNAVADHKTMKTRPSRWSGARIQTYLLEANRVTRCHDGERSYHIFYQLLAGENKKASDFKYLDQSSTKTIEGVNDAEEYKVTLSAMKHLDIPDNTTREIFQIVYGVLWMGNVDLVENDGRAKVAESAAGALKEVANRFGVEASAVEKTLIQEHIVTETANFTKDLGVDAARSKRDCIAQKVFNALFLELVEMINKTLSQGDSSSVCALLDVFGFEHFVKNFFDQLCINYANELLQSFFSECVFKKEQALYKSEGVNWNPVDVPNNDVTIEMLAGKGGIFAIMDEECVMPGGTDKSFVSKITKAFGSNKFFGTSRLNPNVFLVKHYAATVEYTAQGFVESNKDTLSPDSIEVLAVSKNALLAKMFTISLEAPSSLGKLSSSIGSTGGNGRKKVKTVTSMFKAQLQALLQQLQVSVPSFVRCIKPNPEKVPRKVNMESVTEQLRNGGVFQAIEVSRAGYPVRMNYKDTEELYGPLAPKVEKHEVKALMEALDKKYLLSGDTPGWAIGNNLVFLKMSTHETLEKARVNLRMKVAIRIERVARRRLSV